MPFEQKLFTVLGVLLSTGMLSIMLLSGYAIRRRRQTLRVERARARENALSASTELIGNMSNVIIVSVGGTTGETAPVSQEMVNEYLTSISRSPDGEQIEDKTCSICLDDLAEEEDQKYFISPTCPHVFHLDCVGKWVYVGKDADCPYCKTKFFDSKELGCSLMSSLATSTS